MKMDFVIWIIGWLIAVEGIFFLIKPEVIRSAITFLNKGKRLYLIALARLVLGGVFLFAAGECRLVWVIIIGCLLLASGIAGFVIKLEKIKSMTAWWLEKPLLIIRILSIIALAFGAIVVYSAR